MSSAQLRLWFLHQLEPEGCLYNTFLGVELTGPLDVGALDRTLAAIEARHEVLRASFPEREGRPLQQVGPPRSSVLEVIDLRALDSARAERLGWTLARQEVRRPFDLRRGPVWRARLLRLETERFFLVLTLHHVVSDRWSIDVLLFELAHHYEAHLRGVAPLLPALPVQYADFAAWQNDRLEGGLLQPQLEHWTERLRERPEPLDLAADRRPGPVRTSRGGRAILPLPEPLVEALAATSQREGATLFMTMLAGFKVLLLRRSGCEDLIVGTPIANRTRAEIRALIGCFVNTLVLRTDLSGAPTFREAVGRVRQVCVEAYAHQELPLERLVEALQPDRDGGQGLFQVIFALNDQHNPLAGGEQLSGALARQGLSIRPLELDSEAVQADLVLHVERRTGGSKLLLDCSLDLFDVATAERLAREYRVLLEGAAADPDRPLRDLPLLGTAERHQIVAEWNDSATAYPRNATLRDLWLEQVARTPDAVALDFGDQISYGELHRRASRLARRLAAEGVGPGSCVAVHLERSRDLVVALLGVIEAGAAYLPLDTLYPPERIELMVEDAGARLAVTDAALAGNLPAGCRTLLVDDGADAPAPAADPELAPQDLAYVIHTSGSTGRPKGVAVPQQAVIRLVCRTDYVRLTAEDRIAQSSNVSFDAATFEIWGALLHGARLVGLAKETVLEVEALRAALGRHGITVLFLTTSLFHELAAEDPRAFGSLSALVVGGEAMDPGAARRVLAAAPPRRLVNGYGPTETTTFAASCSVVEVPPGATGVPIGRPLANTAIHLLDRRLAPVPLGVTGELFIGGDGTARGYLGRPSLTAASFVPDPFDERPGSRLYRTGDLARRRADGQVEFLGRGDQQVKIRGFRIEPGEIEAVLGDHPAVRQVAVLGLPDPSGGKRLVAYVAVEGPEGPGSRELREHLESRVPEYMVPAIWILMDALPLNANGKLDRAALPAPETVAPDLSETELDAPEDPVEELVAAVWADLLGVRRVGRRDQFFELGGHSLVATRVVARLEEALGVRLPLRTLFERPTVADTAEALRELLGRPQPPASGALPTLVPVPADGHLPFALTEIQEAYWIGRTDAFELGSVSAHGYLELDVEGLDLARLEEVANRLIRRHPMLRAVIGADGRQRTLTDVPDYRIATEDLREAGEAEREAALARTRERLSHQVLPADRFPLFELSASLLPEGLVRLHVGTDALISDAWSWQILAREAALLYERPKAELPGLEVTFRDYMLALEALRETDLHERSLAYWRARLAKFPGAPELPVRSAARQISRPRFVRRGGRLEAEAWRRLKSAGLGRGLTPSGLVLAAFAAVLAAWSKSPRFALNLTLFNRFPFHPDVYRIVGDFTSLTLLEVEAGPEGSFVELARRVQARLWDDLDHRYVSGVRVLRELAAGQGGARVAMPVVFTSLLSLEAPALERDGGALRGRLAYSVSQTPQVWLDHQVHEEQGSLVYTWDAVDEVFLPGVLDAMFEAFTGLLDVLAAEDSPAWDEDVPVLVPEAQLSLRREVNATAAPVPDGRLHGLGLEHLRRDPAAPAVIDVRGTISYEDLFRHAGAVARRLGAAGVAPGELVAVAMRKGREQVSGVLGVLQAGAAYLPVDPDLPAERVRYLLEDGGVGMALTQSAVDGAVPWPDGVERVAVDRVAPEELVPSLLEGGGGSLDLAYVIYTSGSTGRPKGVMIDHRGAVNTVADVNARFALTPEDRVFGISSLSFDLSVWDLFGALAAGAALVLPDPERLREPAHWAEVLHRQQVTVWSSVPALMTLLVEHLRDRGERLPESLRLVMLSGDWIPVSLPDRIRALADQEVQVMSLGGATEASIWSILYPVERVDPEWASIPYGRPLVNQSFHVLDDALEPRPVWVPGELYIGGVGVALGYWKDPERTAAKFLTHPTTGERLYRTGDLGRYLPDGNIEFLGREDFQVKIQGYRIELGEIEAALADHPGVRETVVTVHEGTSGRALVGYVVPAADPPPRHEELRAYLLDRLPEYMVPLVYVTIDAFPLSANGKVDRRALPAPGPARGSDAGPDRGPRSATEEIVAGLFAEVLETPEVGPSDDFFTLGGNSMVATRLVSQLREVFEVEVPLRVVFEATTVEELAARLDGLRDEEAGLRVPPLEPAPRPERVPLSFAQQRLWLVDRLSPGTAAYSMPAGVRLRGRLDAAALARSLETIIERHEALRTTFSEVDGEPVQVVRPPMPLSLPVVDLASLEPGRRESTAFALCRAEARKPFSLEQGPLVRARLFHLAGDDHLLLLAMHHIVSDGWSLGVLVDEIARLYPAMGEGTDAGLPALPVQYGDFALWQRGWLRGEVLESQLRYWRERLQGAPGLIQLPTDRPRPAVQRFRGAHFERVLDPSLAGRLRQVTHEHRVTLFMSMLATFQVLLARLSGQGDVVVGSPIANRTRRELEGLIGFFANTLVLRTDLSDSPPFPDLLRRVREVALGAQSHQDLPFERLVEELQPARALSYMPLFQVMFVLQNAPMTALDLEGLVLEPVQPETGGSHFDLTLRAWEEGDAVRLRFEYDVDLFDGTTVARMARHLEAVLAAALARPETPVLELPMLSPAEQHQVVAEWNGGTAGPPEETALAAVLRQAGERPGAAAVVCGDRRLTYGELAERSGCLAGHLASLGIGAGSPVPVLLERSPETVVTILAVLRIGAFWVPLDPSYPRERVAFALDGVGARVAVTRPALVPLLEAAADPPRWIDPSEPPDPTEPAPGDGAATAGFEPGSEPGRTAYLIYTSGSTGKPKGVQLSVGGLAHYVGALGNTLGVDGDDVYLHTASFGFSSSVRQLFLPLARGATLVVAREEEIADPVRLLGLIRREGVTVLDLVPSFWRNLVHALEALPAARRSGLLDNRVRLVVSASEPLPIAIPRTWRELLGPAGRVVNMFGQTETTGIVTVHPWSGGAGRGGLVPIGRPIPGMHLHLLDPSARLVPLGVAGEIYAGGPGLGLGYLGQPALTARVFVPDPFSGVPGGRLYRTGDLGRRRPDGGVEFVGRRDQQVKVRGFRVEPGEVEAVLTGHDRVAAAIVLSVEDAAGFQGLAAFVVPATGQAPEVTELRDVVRSRLPEYMVPSSFRVVPELPMTPTGKVDRQALRRLGREEGPTEGEGPRTPVEAAIATIFAEVLGRETVGRDESFFDLGGHSLTATQAMSRVSQAFGVSLPLRRVFEAPTVADLAFQVEAARREGLDELVALEPVDRDGELPLSFAQQRLWLIHQLEPSSAAYNTPVALELTGSLDAGALEGAFREVAFRHEILRTRFETADGEPIQVVEDRTRVGVPLVDLSRLAAEPQRREARRVSLTEARRPFDLARTPLFRARLLRLGPARHLLLLTVHHIVSDGWSVAIWVREVAEAYRAVSRGEAPSLPGLPVQYADFAAWQRRYLRGEVLDRQLTYWRARLSADDLELPADRPRPAVLSGRGGTRTLALSRDLSAAVKSSTRRSRVTEFTTLLAAYFALLHRITGRSRFHVGTPIAGRTRREMEGLIGCFVNTLVLTGEVAGSLAFDGLVERVWEAVLGAHDHQDLPFERLIEELQPRRRLNASPLFQVMFILQNAPRQAVDLGGLELRQLELGGGAAKFDLTLALGETGEGLVATAEFSSDLFDGATADRLLRHYSVLLEAATADGDRALADLPLLTAAERHQVGTEWNDTRTAYPSQAPIHRLFRDQASRRPDAVALDSEHGSVTYGELGRRAAGLARRLVALGVGPEERVAVCLERSPALVECFLAILEAGAAFVPLDPAYPRERIAFMLEDSEAKAVLTAARWSEAFEAAGVPVVALDGPGPVDDPDDRADLPASLGSEALAYVIYTSGSTGTPKGSGVVHRSVVRLVHGTSYARFGEDETVLFFTSPSFDVSIFEIWGALLHGGRLAVGPSGRVSASELGRFLTERRVTTAWLTAGLFHLMVDEEPRALANLSQLLAGGEALSADHVGRVLEAFPRVRMIDGYGPTENATFSAAHTLSPGEIGPWGVPIGRAIANSTAWVVDGTGRPVAAGVPGELRVGGDGLSRGYQRRPSLTAERFVPDPFCGTPGARLYCTGDLVRHRHDGVLEFLGRTDRQLKLRGFRVEPGEIEEALRVSSEVRDAAVDLRPGPSGEPRLVAWAVPEEGAAPSAVDLRGFLRQRLPEYMIPASLTWIDSLPLTPNGKVDRAALEDPGVEAAAGRPDHEPPRTELEARIAEIWTVLLGVDAVGVHDDFFAIGGHSLVAARFVSRLESVAGVQLPLRAVFETPTVAGLAERIELLTWAAESQAPSEDETLGDDEIEL